MSRSYKLIDKYLLSIAVTLGVIAFAYDFFTHSDTFNLTKAAVALIAFAATRERAQSQKRIDAVRKQKGLTQEDIDNIAFVKYKPIWQVILGGWRAVASTDWISPGLRIGVGP